LQPGETQTVTFELDVQRLGFLDAHIQHVVEPGAFEVMVGSSSADIRLSGGLEVV
jgi:beta-glucosidase